MSKQALPSDKEIATLFGLEEFRSCLHTIRKYPLHGEPIGYLWVNYCWKAIVKPHSSDHIILCGAVAKPADHYPQQTLVAGWKKIVLATDNDSAVLSFDDDPISEELFKFNILPFDNRGIVVDGIAYEIYASTLEMQSKMSFANPKSTDSLRLVDTLFKVAKIIAQTSKKNSLCNSVDLWERCL